MDKKCSSNSRQSSCHCSVKIKNVSYKKDGSNILYNVSLTANHGEMLALIGRNGSGKTTLLKAIMGRIPYTGSIEFFNSSGEKINKPRIGYVPQTLLFDKSTPMTVLDMFCANSSKLPIWLGHTNSRIKRVKHMLKKVGAEPLINKSLGMLSGGELQRVLLAYALDPRPDILLLDEPVSAVDRKGISLFYELLSSMRNEYHMPVIIVSHDLGHVKKYATSAALIEGTVVVLDDARKIMDHPRIKETFGLDIDGGDI